MEGAGMMSLRSNATLAHLLPLVVFMAFLTLPGWFRIENPELPWFQRAPEHWIYPIQTLVCAAILWCFRRHYTLAPWRGLPLASGLAVIGIVLWIAPSQLREALIARAVEPAPWWDWLGIVERKEGFDPGVLAAWPWWQKAGLCMRFVRMVLIVPLIEELVWRGFLMRYVIAGDRPWRSIPFGTHDWRAYGIVTGMVTLAHNPEDYLAAFLWGSLVYYLAVRTRSLGACVFMHAVGNLLLGLYALITRNYGFW